MQLFKVLLPYLLLLCITGCSTTGKALRVGGEDGTLSGIIMPVKETYEEENGIPLTIVQSKPGAELIDLKKGSVDLIVAMQTLPELLQEAARQKVAVDPGSLQQFEVGKTTIVVFLHKKNKTRKLTRKQLKAIFTGKMTNWKQLGGVDREISVVWNGASTAETDIFIKEILDGATLGAKMLTASNFEEVRSRVMATPGAIGIAPQGFMGTGVKIPKSPSVASKVIAVTIGEPSHSAEKLIELLKDVAAYIQ